MEATPSSDGPLLAILSLVVGLSIQYWTAELECHQDHPYNC